MKAIIIWATINRLEWLNNCLNSFNGYNKYPIVTLMINNGKGRFGDIKREIEKLNYDEFIILQDSMEVKNPDIFDICFEQYEGKSVSLCSTPAKFGNFHGKFLKDVFSRCSNLDTNSKMDDVMAELKFSQDYVNNCGEFIDLCDLSHTNNFEMKFDRLNMVTENDYFKKLKGTWALNMVK